MQDVDHGDVRNADSLRQARRKRQVTVKKSRAVLKEAAFVSEVGLKRLIRAYCCCTPQKRGLEHGRSHRC